jgi:hypothetical protein
MSLAVAWIVVVRSRMDKYLLESTYLKYCDVGITSGSTRRGSSSITAPPTSTHNYH